MMQDFEFQEEKRQKQEGEQKEEEKGTSGRGDSDGGPSLWAWMVFLVKVVFWIVVLVVGVVFMLYVFAPHPHPTSSAFRTSTGNAGDFKPPQEAVFRLADVNQVRQDAYNALQPGQKPDQRNVGMAEVVALHADGTTSVLYVTQAFWGANTGGHSETLSMADVENYLLHHPPDSSVVALHILIVSQYDVCDTCVANIRSITTNLRQKLSPVRVTTSIWEVNAFIDPKKPKTWVAPTKPDDIHLVDRDQLP